MAALLPRRRLGPAATRRRSTRSQRARPPAGHHSFDALVRGAAADEPARRARRHAAVGGPPALPLHAGRDEERDADAVRDRLPAGVRRGQPAHVRPAQAAVHRDGDRRRSRRPCTSWRPARSTGSSSRERRAPSSSPFGAGARAGVAGDRGLRRAASASRWPCENTTEVADGPDAHRGARRARCCRRTSSCAARPAGASCRPSRRPRTAATAVMTCANVNTFPVLATPADDAVLGAAIMLPDHPRDRAREPRQPVRLDRDRGGAAAARAGAQRRRARASSPTPTRPSGR